MAFSKNKENLIFCSSEYITSNEYGGLAIFLEKFLRNLKKEFNIHLIVSSTFNKRKKHQGIYIHHVKTNYFYLKFLKKFFSTIFFTAQSWLLNRKIDELIKKNSIKFVHFSNYQCLGLFYNNKLPIITRLSSLETLWDNSNLFSFNKILERYTLSRSNLILSPSKFLISELKREYNLRSYFIPPLIEKLKIKKIYSKKKIVLTFGSISPGKGSIAIEESINDMLKINKDIYYYWIGNVDKKFYNSNSDFEKKLKLKTSYPSRVKVIPKMRRDKLFKFISKSNIILLPSLRDNSPNACLEALSMNKIVIARRKSGYDDLIKNNFNGYLFNKSKNHEIAYTIKKCMKASSNKKNEIKKNIKFQNKLFYPKQIVSSYKMHLNKII